MLLSNVRAPGLSRRGPAPAVCARPTLRRAAVVRGGARAIRAQAAAAAVAVLERVEHEHCAERVSVATTLESNVVPFHVAPLIQQHDLVEVAVEVPLPPGRTVELRGSWNDGWALPVEMDQVDNKPEFGYANYRATLWLPAFETFEFKLVVDGKWCCTSAYPVVGNSNDFNRNNRLVVDPSTPIIPLPATATAADASVPAGRHAPQPPFEQYMYETHGTPYMATPKSIAFDLYIDGSADGRFTSRAAVKLLWRPAGSHQAFAEAPTCLPAEASAGHRLATVFSAGPVEWFCQVQDSRAPGGFSDVRGQHGALFASPAPGAYVARPGGSASAWAAGAKGRILLVLDIDGTLYNEHDSSAMDAFAKEYAATSALLGSAVALCTGRSIGQTAGLLARNPQLPLISFVAEAVGTKIWRRLEGRSGHSVSDWEEVAGYRAYLDDGSWDVAAARAAAVKVEARHGNHKAVCMVQDDGTEHPHRISLCMRHEGVAAAVASIGAELERGGVQHKVIVSGCSSHRHVDILPARGGKEAATQFLRQLVRLPNSRVVAAGDSGNDIDMLSGPHPAIVVGNAQPDLAAWAAYHIEHLYTTLYCARHGFAAGITEGLAHFGLM